MRQCRWPRREVDAVGALWRHPQRALLYALAITLSSGSAWIRTAPASGRGCTRVSPSMRVPNGQQEVKLRQGRQADYGVVLRSMIKESMNPLFLNLDNFVVAERHGRIQGFGQVRPIAGSKTDWELASVYVTPEARGQGLGSRIIRELVIKFRGSVKEASPAARLFLLCLRTTSDLYRKQGFQEVDIDSAKDLPATLRLEYAAGQKVAGWVTGIENNLVCLQLIKSSD